MPAAAAMPPCRRAYNAPSDGRTSHRAIFGCAILSGYRHWPRARAAGARANIPTASHCRGACGRRKSGADYVRRHRCCHQVPKGFAVYAEQAALLRGNDLGRRAAAIDDGDFASAGSGTQGKGMGKSPESRCTFNACLPESDRQIHWPHRALSGLSPGSSVTRRVRGRIHSSKTGSRSFRTVRSGPRFKVACVQVVRSRPGKAYTSCHHLSPIPFPDHP